MQDHFREAGVGGEVRVDRGLGSVKLQFHDGLEYTSPRVLLASERPGLWSAAIREEREATYSD